jgi:hypothetical protein
MVNGIFRFSKSRTRMLTYRLKWAAGQKNLETLAGAGQWEEAHTQKPVARNGL